MITIVWILTGFHIVDVLLEDSKFNAYNYVSVILQSLADCHVGEIRTTDRKLIVLLTMLDFT
jgi:hypothetical protein